MSLNITETQATPAEIVIQERVTTNEFVISEISENIANREVRVTLEMGPFTTETRPDGSTERRGRGRRGIMVWRNEEYDAIRDTWTNADLVAAVKAKL